MDSILLSNSSSWWHLYELSPYNLRRSKPTSCVFCCTLINLDNSLLELDEGLVGCSLKHMEDMDVDTGFVTPVMGDVADLHDPALASNIPGQVD